MTDGGGSGESYPGEGGGRGKNETPANDFAAVPSFSFEGRKKQKEKKRGKKEQTFRLFDL
jgi:hypothetical protein